ncbi:Two-component sensor histidine kinase, contains HisKA and HATPase domains [Tistlia consotensis]|uniref:histidine kinase n=1 Tax=Tistlia consotensis USBA 355 TaxID=560819 RepID=A0A1Y6CVW0_9PROT|nr:histidine kinase dimerization/phosphoacceptor domain -containing protein [Tistlia consotensis]SMF80868.1 Two-component sensor histidine kinase, contains HisKA and HATPase domains [Tistlia consotensis USBA 355]SNS21965.1 Two-component sensor histidine kinase, contains HisKA and HATPase domains [Tistlia consotensis]
MPYQGFRVLYIDDDPALARLVQKTLARRGYAVEHADSAESGLARLDAGGIDVIALDHYLPTGTGLDVLARLGEVPARPPVVYVTGSAETAVAVAALKAGACDYVPKAASEEFLELLGSAVDQAIDAARLMREKERAEREMREARERAELLLGEVNHRVSNSLALVAALVSMQAKAVTQPAARDALSETQARILAIAGIHRRLYTSEDVRIVELGGYLRSLIEDLEASMRSAGHGAAVRLEVENLAVATDKAVSIGVLLTELVTNAFKYAYPGTETGEVRIGFRALGPGRAELSVEDDGVGWNGEGRVQGTGLGSRIVRAMASNLGGVVCYAERERGTRVFLAFTL